MYLLPQIRNHAEQVILSINERNPMSKPTYEELVASLKRVEAHLSIYPGPDPAVHAAALTDVRRMVVQADPSLVARVGI